jgi:hypothetical protein
MGDGKYNSEREPSDRLQLLTLINVFEIGRFAPVLSCDCFFAEATLIQETPAAVSDNR